MKLYQSLSSPFVRKVNMTAQILGLAQEIEPVFVDVSKPDTSYVRINPLNKIPALETRTGEILVDSKVICEYLIHLAHDHTLIPLGPERWRVLSDQAMADGLTDATVLRMMETRRPPDRFDARADHRQKLKIEQALQYFDSHRERLKGEMNLAGLALLSALGYLELRFPQEKWLERFPYVKEWYLSKFSWPPFSMTKPK